jgi:hypothetical protein
VLIAGKVISDRLMCGAHGSRAGSKRGTKAFIGWFWTPPEIDRGAYSGSRCAVLDLGTVSRPQLGSVLQRGPCLELSTSLYNIWIGQHLLCKNTSPTSCPRLYFENFNTSSPVERKMGYQRWITRRSREIQVEPDFPSCKRLCARIRARPFPQWDQGQPC